LFICLLFSLNSNARGFNFQAATICLKKEIGEGNLTSVQPGRKSFISRNEIYVPPIAFVGFGFLANVNKQLQNFNLKIREEVLETNRPITIAATTGTLRIYHNKHWLTDVVAGAGIGILSTALAYFIYPKVKKVIPNRYVNKTQNLHLDPTFQSNQAGFALVYNP